MAHIPVLFNEVLTFLDPKLGETFVDATLGDGGHALAIIERLGKNGRFLGIDADPTALKTAENRIQKSELRAKELLLEKENFANLKSLIQKHKLAPVDGILFDLGIRSEQFEESRRGFSFLRDEPLDMRFDATGRYASAADIVHTSAKEALEQIFRKFGEERFSKDIAEAIVEARKKEKLATTQQLVEIILSVYRRRLHSKKEIPWIGGIHPATRVFQALRIAVNHELENLEKVLPDAIDALARGGRIAIISFHSLEDRIVKHFLRSKADIKILTKKPVVPTDKEIAQNPRSRSAKLRAAIKII